MYLQNLSSPVNSTAAKVLLVPDVLEYPPASLAGRPARVGWEGVAALRADEVHPGLHHIPIHATML